MDLYQILHRPTRFKETCSAAAGMALCSSRTFRLTPEEGRQTLESCLCLRKFLTLSLITGNFPSQNHICFRDSGVRCPEL